MRANSGRSYNNVSFAVFRLNLPIVTGSQDGTVKTMDGGTYRIGDMLGYALERAWCVLKDANEVIALVDFDIGVVALRFVFSLKTIFTNL